MVATGGLVLVLSATLLLASCQSKQQAEVDLKPNTPALEQVYQQGRAAYVAAHYDEAAQAFARVAAADPEHLNALINWGVALSRGGQPQEALTKFRQALARDPNNAAVWYNIGVALERLGKHDDAIAHYDQAVALDPTRLTPALEWYLERLRPKAQDTQIGISPSQPPPTR